jgi:hypothetical protein
MDNTSPLNQLRYQVRELLGIHQVAQVDPVADVNQIAIVRIR